MRLALLAAAAAVLLVAVVSLANAVVGPGVIAEEVYVIRVDGVAYRLVRVEDWEVAVSDVAVVDAAALGDVCYGAGEGGKLAVRVEVRNLGNARFPPVTPFFLLTDRDLEDLRWTEERPRPYPVYREGELYILGARAVGCGGKGPSGSTRRGYTPPPNASVRGAMPSSRCRRVKGRRSCGSRCWPCGCMCRGVVRRHAALW